MTTLKALTNDQIAELLATANGDVSYLSEYSRTTATMVARLEPATAYGIFARRERKG